MTDYPQRNFGFDSSGRALDLQTNEYLKADPNLDLHTDSEGWLCSGGLGGGTEQERLYGRKNVG